MLPELKEFRWWAIGAIIGIAFAAMADLTLPKLLAKMINQGVTTGSRDEILRIGTMMLIVAVVTLLGAVLGNYCAATFGAGFSRKMRRKVFEKVQTFGLSEMNEQGTASLITRNTNDVRQVQQFMMMFVRIFVRFPILLIGGIIMTYTESPRLARPLLLSIPLILCIILLVSRFIVPLFKTIQKKIDGVNRILREQITGIRVVRAFGTEEHESERFDVVSQDYSNTSLKMMRIMSLMGPLLTIVMNLTIMGILVLGSRDVNNGLLKADGSIVAVVQYVTQIMFALIMMSVAFIVYPRAVASAERIYEVLDMKPEITDLVDTRTPDESVKGVVEFRKVSFTYPGAERPTIASLNFTVNKGETTAIIGSTGSGKTTILRMILRFYEATQGCVLVDGVDVREMSQKDLRSRIGYVPQKAFLFSGNVEENLKFGKENSTYKEMKEAVETAQVLEYIEETDDQFYTHVAQGGTNFSGGQRQRLSIARAMIRKPEILLFDDSFSALDAATDLKLRKALEKDAKGITKIIVAQRVSSIAHADHIIVLDHGCVVGQGTHKELLENCHVYREIADSQFSEEEVAQ